MSLADQILATPFVRDKTPVSVPQWPGTDGKLFIRTLNALENERYSTIVRRADRDPTVCIGAEVAALVLVDEQGSPVFTTPEATAKLAAGDPAPLDVIFAAWLGTRPKREDVEKK